ncbi:hypothetical protein NPIL_427831, partial [Nephila pilipes]
TNFEEDEVSPVVGKHLNANILKDIIFEVSTQFW